MDKKVADIQRSEDGVRVSCTDGSEYHGAIVIGADGVHSMVRRKMRQLAAEQGGSEEADKENPFTTAFQCLWIRFPTPSHMSSGIHLETHGPQVSTQFFTGEETAVAGVYVRLDKPKQVSSRYTALDEVDVVDRWGHLPLDNNSNLTLRDVYQDRIQSGLVDLEEGVLKNWHLDGKLVLVGDSCHKFTRELTLRVHNPHVPRVR